MDSPALYVPLTLCDWGISVTVNPFSLSKLSSVSLLSLLSARLRGLSLPALAFLVALVHRTLFSLPFLFQLIDYIFFFLPFIISVITTSPSLLAYLHCGINSKLYSMLSTCLFLPPPPHLYPRRRISASRPFRLVSSLQREPQRDREAPAEQDDGLHHGAVRHGAHLQRAGSQTRQADHPANGRVAHEVSARERQHQLGWVVQTLVSHRPGMSSREVRPIIVIIIIIKEKETERSERAAADSHRS